MMKVYQRAPKRPQHKNKSAISPLPSTVKCPLASPLISNLCRSEVFSSALRPVCFAHVSVYESASLYRAAAEAWS